MEKDMQDAVIDYGLTCYKRGMRDYDAIIYQFMNMVQFVDEEHKDKVMKALTWAEALFDKLSVENFRQDCDVFFAEEQKENQDE